MLFLADDHGWDIAACYGNRVIRTPNLDRLASEGLRFTQAFAGSPTCSPSRAILYTGLHSAARVVRPIEQHPREELYEIIRTEGVSPRARAIEKETAGIG